MVRVDPWVGLGWVGLGRDFLLISEQCGGVQFRSSAAVVVGLIQVSVTQKRSGLWVSIRSDKQCQKN